MEKSKVIEKLFKHIVIYSYLILPLLFFVVRYKPKDAKILAVYGIVFCALLYFYYDVPIQYEKYYQALYTFLEYSFFASLFYINIPNKRYRRLILFLSLGFVIFQIIYLFVFDNNRLDSIPVGIESILIFIYIFLFFLEDLNTSRSTYIYYHHCFWISVGLLFYLGGSFFINILANTFSDEEFKKYWYLNYVADTIKTLLFAVSFMFLKNKSTESTRQPSSIPYLDVI